MERTKEPRAAMCQTERRACLGRLCRCTPPYRGTASGWQTAPPLHFPRSETVGRGGGGSFGAGAPPSLSSIFSALNLHIAQCICLFDSDYLQMTLLTDYLKPTTRCSLTADSQWPTERTDYFPYLPPICLTLLLSRIFLSVSKNRYSIFYLEFFFRMSIYRCIITKY